MFGFTIISTKKLEEMRASGFDYMVALKRTIEEKQKQIDALFEKLGKDLLETQQKQRDIELRKWCVEQYRACGRICDERAADIYRFVTTGDTAALDSSPLRFRIESLEQENKKLKEELAGLQEKYSDSQNHSSQD